MLYVLCPLGFAKIAHYDGIKIKLSNYDVGPSYLLSTSNEGQNNVHVCVYGYMYVCDLFSATITF